VKNAIDYNTRSSRKEIYVFITEKSDHEAHRGDDNEKKLRDRSIIDNVTSPRDGEEYKLITN